MSAEVPVRVLFFAELREIAGVDSLALNIEPEAGRAGLVLAVTEQLSRPELAARLNAPNVRLAVNQALAATPGAFAAGDELAFLPPVTGG
jgi:molybdopterin synthase sulfur carrier subunit